MWRPTLTHWEIPLLDLEAAAHNFTLLPTLTALQRQLVGASDSGCNGASAVPRAPLRRGGSSAC